MKTGELEIREFTQSTQGWGFGEPVQAGVGLLMKRFST